MRPDDLNDILAGDQDIVPSSGFVSAVMDAVREDALSPPPIPFPWRRALPGIGAVLVTFVLVVLQALKPGSPATPTTTMLDAGHLPAAVWILAGLLVTFACVKLSFYLARRPG